MKTVSDFRADMLTILGDAGGRRYSESMLDMGLTEALADYGGSCPYAEFVQGRITAYENGSAVVQWAFPPSVTPRNVIRKVTNRELKFSLKLREGKLLLTFHEALVPAVGEVLLLELPMPYRIRGLNDASDTTVPDAHALMVCTGAAGYAMRIRARSVTEVFGKRPEDREALAVQADQLIAAYSKNLQKISLIRSFQQDPWPESNFRI